MVGALPWDASHAKQVPTINDNCGAECGGAVKLAVLAVAELATHDPRRLWAPEQRESHGVEPPGLLPNIPVTLRSAAQVLLPAAPC